MSGMSQCSCFLSAPVAGAAVLIVSALYCCTAVLLLAATKYMSVTCPTLYMVAAKVRANIPTVNCPARRMTCLASTRQTPQSLPLNAYCVLGYALEHQSQHSQVCSTKDAGSELICFHLTLYSSNPVVLLASTIQHMAS